MQFFCKDSYDFGLSVMNRTIKISILTVFLILATAVNMHSGPARVRDAVYSQPDGSTFAVKVKGDEWTRIRTTSDGCAIVKEDDGWWCYGTYDSNGRLKSTGLAVGKSAPSDVLSASRMIPFKVLSENARRLRMQTAANDSKALEVTRKSSKAITKGSASKIQKKGIAILAQFQDQKFKYTKEDVHNLLNQAGYQDTGSAKEYYEYQFGENWEFTFDVSDIVTLPRDREYYGENDPTDGTDLRAAEMIRDACRLADEKIDFSQYDQDGDGEVDNVYVFLAGHDEAEFTDQTDLIWSHQWYVYTGGGFRLICDGVLIDRYACSSELSGRSSMAGIGLFCHEYAHTFGLPDFYDTNYDEDNAQAAGLWNKTSLMDGGSYNNHSATPPNFNCIERHLLGLSEPEELKSGNSYLLEPIHKNGQYYIMNGRTPGEYFLFECRSNEGWDKYIGGKGMLAYHIDENAKENIDGRWFSKWEWNTVNADPSHQCADLIEADGRSDLITDIDFPFRDIRGIFFPQPGRTALIPDGYPTYRFWNGTIPEYAIIGIAAQDDDIRFKVTGSTEIPDVPDVTGFSFQAYPDAIFISFKSSDPSINGSAFLEWRQNEDSTYDTIVLDPSPDGSYSYLINSLKSDNTLYDIQIRFEVSGATGNVHKVQIMTKRSPDVTWPYLYTTDGGNISRSEGFIAHAVNTGNAAHIAWYLDEEELEVKDDCRIYPTRDGNLSCVITWKNGSTDTIVKEITLTE